MTVPKYALVMKNKVSNESLLSVLKNKEAVSSNKSIALILLIFMVHMPSLHSFAQGWVQKADHLGGAVYGSTGFAIGTKGYFSCGYQGGGYTETWEWDQSTDTWTQKANYPSLQSAYLGVAFSIGTKGYRGTGREIGTSVRSTDFYEFDPVANTWTAKASLPVARYLGVGLAINGKGYIGLGTLVGGLTDFYEFDPVANTWTAKANYPGSGINNCTSFSIGTKGYVGMGEGGGSSHQDFWEYDPSGNSWTQKTNFGGVARNGATGFSIGNNGYVTCGNNGGTYYKDFWGYDPVANSWTQLTDFGGVARSNSEIGFAIGNLAYVGTGYGGGGLQDFWEYGGPLLPIELLTFSANWQDETYQTVLIKWQTEQEINNDYFEIERSTDAINFNSIRHVDGAGNSVERISYQETDTEPYQKGPSYYRLKQVDFDGTFSYSQIETLNAPDGLDIINLYPNPVRDALNFTLLSSLTAEIDVRINNALGQNVYFQAREISHGVTPISISLPNFGDGNYYLEVALSSGESRVQRKFIVNKKN